MSPLTYIVIVNNRSRDVHEKQLKKIKFNLKFVLRLYVKRPENISSSEKSGDSSFTLCQFESDKKVAVPNQ